MLNYRETLTYSRLRSQSSKAASYTQMQSNIPRIRKQLSYAFSQRALDGQVPLIQSHIETLIAQLRTRAESGTSVNIADWFNFVSFDIIGHLAYGESFGCLEKGEYHPYASFILEAFKGGLFASACNRYGLLSYAMLLMPAEMARKRMTFLATSLELTQKRIGQEEPNESQKHDFFSYMLSKENPEKSMTFGEMATNAIVFMLAGSESTATLLSGTLLFLLKDVPRMQKLTKEIRDAFETEDQITTASSSKLKYMSACLEEGLRMATPAPFGVARRDCNANHNRWERGAVRHICIGWPVRCLAFEPQLRTSG